MDDKYRFSDFGLYVEEGHEHPAIPNMQRKTLHIPGRSGLWDFGVEVREKSFIFPIATLYSKKEDKIELQTKLNRFIEFLYDDFGQPREIKMVFDYEPDKFYLVKVSDSFIPSRVSPFSGFDLSLIAYNPYKHSNVYADEITWGSETITFEYNYLLGHESLGGSVNITGPQTFNLSFEGLAVQPVFEIEGTANNLKFECGKYNFTLPNFSNTKWTIDFEKYLVWRNGQETMIEIRDFYLMPG